MTYTSPVETEPPKKRGRKPKPEEEKYVARTFKFPPSMWKFIADNVSEGDRAEIVRRCLMRSAQARHRAKQAGEEPPKEE